MRHLPQTRGKTYKAPDPAPLPKSRIQEVTRFTITEVDFTGALYVQMPTGESKVYIYLFTCTTVRAVHLAVVQNLNEDTFLQVFRRFASRKSLPKKMISDNASTYLPAAEELKRLFQSPTSTEAFNQRGIEWQFIPKRAPWFGSFWERLIGLTKNLLKKILERAYINLVSLQTVVTEIEAILNDRPLTYLSSDIRGEEPRTRITSLPYTQVEGDEINDPDFGSAFQLKRSFKKQAFLIQHFHSLWKEYLTSLREFQRTTGRNTQTMRTGDVILIHDDCPRTRWKLVVIQDLIRGRDVVRAANIRTSTGKTNRPVTKLYPLEISTNVTSDPSTTDKPDESRTDLPQKLRTNQNPEKQQPEGHPKGR